jgi:hypothetical protein
MAVVGHDIFFATGNTFGAGTWSDGEAVFRAGSGLQRSSSKRDYFAPLDWRTLDAADEDLAGSNPLPLDIPGAAGGQALLALGKDRNAYFLIATTSAASVVNWQPRSFRRGVSSPRRSPTRSAMMPLLPFKHRVRIARGQAGIVE